MQQFTGKVGESYLIGENIRIIILKVKGAQTRIEIQSPDGAMQVKFRSLFAVPSSGDHHEKEPVISGKHLGEKIGEQME